MKKILAVSALVSLIPLASISIVSCKNSETNNQEQQKPTPDNPSNPSTPDTPGIEKPEGGDGNTGTGGSGGGSDSDQNKPSETPSNPDVEQQLLAAKEKLSIVAKQFDHSQVRANEITKENFDTYFTLNGKMDGFNYVFNKIEPIGENQLKIYYKIELNGQSVDYSSITFDGFKGLNQIDYDYRQEKDFFTIALNKEHLNTIAFAAQRYTNADLTKPGWTLDFNNKANYELTKTGQYIIFNGVKMNIHKIKFIIEKPIFVPDVLGGPHNAPFTPQGKEYHDTNGGFQIAIQDGQNELVI